MINVTSLYLDQRSDRHRLRYGDDEQNGDSTDRRNKKPVVVLNLTRDCNLACDHCYSDSRPERFPGQWKTDTILQTLEDLADFGVPAVLLSGGEPLVHPDFRTIVKRCYGLGLPTTVSTNGMLITDEMARFLEACDVRYVGVSLDGLEPVHDRIRNREGAFQQALRGIRSIREAGLKAGVRLTMTRDNVRNLPQFFDLLLRERVDRVCFYHLAYSGRGEKMQKIDLSPEERFRAVETIADQTHRLHKEGHPLQTLTVANPVDNVYFYHRIQTEDPVRADEIYDRLRRNGGALNSSGVGVGSVDFYGNVHPNQFWMDRSLGNVSERAFSDIWTSPDKPFLQRLRNRLEHLEEPCRECPWLEICGGGMRIRAETDGNLWGRDPACYREVIERKYPAVDPPNADSESVE